MEEYLAQLTSLTKPEPFLYRVEFMVCLATELEDVLKSQMGDVIQGVTHENFYSFTIRPTEDGFSVDPEDSLNDCFQVYHQYEYVDNLEPRLRRLWKSAYLTNQMVQTLVNAHVFDFVSSVPHDEQEEDLEAIVDTMLN